MKWRYNTLNIHNKEIKALHEWNKMKALGKRKYIWINGVVKWGLSMGIFMPFIGQMIDEGFILYSFTNYNFIRRLIICLIIFPIGGYIQSSITWRIYEKKYEKNKK